MQPASTTAAAATAANAPTTDVSRGEREPLIARSESDNEFVRRNRLLYKLEYAFLGGAIVLLLFFCLFSLTCVGGYNFFSSCRRYHLSPPPPLPPNMPADNCPDYTEYVTDFCDRPMPCSIREYLD